MGRGAPDPATEAAAIVGVHRSAIAASWYNSGPYRMDWASVESSRKRIPLCAHEIAPGLAIRWPPPTMLATDAEWWGSL